MSSSVRIADVALVVGLGGGDPDSIGGGGAGDTGVAAGMTFREAVSGSVPPAGGRCVTAAPAPAPVAPGAVLRF
jgi:hypothetical protein